MYTRKALILALFTLLAILVLPSTITTSAAPDYSKVGVREGDTAEYWIHEISHYYGTNYTTGEPVHFHFDVTGYCDGFHIHLFVAYVQRSNVTLTITFYYPNGTLYEEQQLTIDVSSGTHIWTPIPDPVPVKWASYSLLTASGLEPGDPIYPGSPFVIDESLLRIGGLNIPGMTIGGRNILGMSFGGLNFILVNHVSFSETYFPSDEYYWEKSSGLLVEHNHALMSIIDGVRWGATLIYWFNVTSALLNGGEQPTKFNPIDITTGTLTLLAGVATAVTLAAIFITANRKQHRQTT